MSTETLPERAPITAGTRIGVWTVVDKIGEGGMGVVYRATRHDGQFSQTVAIKVLNNVTTASAVTRLLAERQLLAQLEHPNIARLIDGGCEASGQPYIVMDYVVGTDISAHCRAANLSPRAIATLFSIVCDAVSYAHQSLALHCDLKPTNILIDQAGRPKLLDFGLARLVDNATLNRGANSGANRILAAVADTAGLSAPPVYNKSSATATDTATSTATGYTPHFSSPEQRAGAPLSTATDVFSLGRLLLALLAVDGDDLFTREARAIGARAAALDIKQRYASVADLSADVSRLLKHQTVLAYAGNMGNLSYRSVKLLQRQWVAFAGLAALAFIAGVFTISLIIQRDRAVQAEHLATARASEAVAANIMAKQAQHAAEGSRKLAELNRNSAEDARNTAISERAAALTARSMALLDRDRAEAAELRSYQAARKALAAEAQTQIEAASTVATRDFLMSLFDSADPNKGGAPKLSAADLLAQGRSRVNQIPGSQAALKTNLLLALGQIHTNIGYDVEASKLYQEVINQARANNDGYGQGAGKTATTDQYIEALNRVGTLEYNNGNIPSALTAAREAYTLRLRTAPRDGAPAAQQNGYLLKLAETQNILGLALANADQKAESEQYLLASLRAREAAEPQPGDATATSLHNLGIYYSRNNNDVESERYFVAALNMKLALYGKHHPKALNTSGRLGVLYARQRRFALAEPLLADAYFTRLQLHGPNNEYVATAANEWASALHDMARYQEAEKYYLESSSSISRNGGDAATRTISYAISINNLASLYEETGDNAKAEPLYRESLAIRAAKLPDDDPSVARARHNLGRLLLKNGNLAESKALLTYALRVRETKQGAKHGETAETLLALAEQAWLEKDAVLATQLLNRVDDTLAAGRPTRWLYKRYLEATFLGSTDAALPIWADRARYAQAKLGFESIITQRTKLNLAEAELAAGNTDAAQKIVQEIKTPLLAMLAKSAPERARIERLEMPYFKASPTTKPP